MSEADELRAENEHLRQAVRQVIDLLADAHIALQAALDTNRPDDT